MAKLVGYVRVSTQDQEVQLQVDALEKAGCAKNMIFIDKISGIKSERPGLEKCLTRLTAGDTLLAWRLDRLGRSMPHLVQLIEDLGQKGIGFRSLCDGVIDTTTASGELIFNIFSSLAQFERRLIQERTRAGLAAARARGKQGGRKKISSIEPKVLMAKNMHQNHGMSINDICKTFQLCSVRLYGRFLLNCHELSAEITNYLARQLELPPTLTLKCNELHLKTAKPALSAISEPH